MTYRGKGILWGINDLTATSASLIASCSFQSRDWKESMTEETIKDCTGEIVTQITFGQVQDATFEYVFTGGTNTGTATVVPFRAGDVVALATTSVPAMSGSWLVMDSAVKSTNAGAAICTVTCKRYSGITY